MMLRLIPLFTLAGAAYPAVIDRSSTCTPGPFVSNGRHCIIECGTDHAGGDYSSLYTQDFKACIDACSSDLQCMTAQFSTSNSYCYLKNEVKPSSSNADVDSIICGNSAADCTAGSIVLNGRQGMVECGIDHQGGDYASYSADSLQACERLCAADSACLTAQYAVDIEYCYLKSVVHPATYNSNVNGIVFPQAAPSFTTLPSSTVVITTTTTAISSVVTTVSTTTSSSTASQSPTCLAFAPLGSYLSNGGFESGTESITTQNYLGTTESSVTQGIAFEGCYGFVMTPTSSPSSNRQFAVSFSHANYPASASYTFTATVGRPNGTLTTNSSAPYVAIVGGGKEFGGGYICGFANTGSCPSSGAGGAVGEVISATFPIRSPSSPVTLVFTWLGTHTENDPVLLDNARLVLA